MATIIDGKAVSAAIKEQVRNQTIQLRQQGIVPCLAVILVGDDPASQVYVNNKEKACDMCEFRSLKYTLPTQTSQAELLTLIDKLNGDPSVNGILVQLPLPKHIDEDAVIKAIDPQKDVDAFHPVNVGKIMQGTCTLLPCTPAGIMELIASTGIEVSGKDCVVIGRSNIVGKPMAMLLLHKNGTVTICHSRTRDLKEKCKNADILVAAVGIPNFVTADMVKDGAVVIDVGINRLENGKLCGDVDFAQVEPVCGAITPVPGGVGPMTIAMLMNNTLIATKQQNGLK